MLNHMLTHCCCLFIEQLHGKGGIVMGEKKKAQLNWVITLCMILPEIGQVRWERMPDNSIMETISTNLPHTQSCLCDCKNKKDNQCMLICLLIVITTIWHQMHHQRQVIPVIVLERLVWYTCSINVYDLRRVLQRLKWPFIGNWLPDPTIWIMCRQKHTTRA